MSYYDLTIISNLKFIQSHHFFSVLKINFKILLQTQCLYFCEPVQSKHTISTYNKYFRNNR